MSELDFTRYGLARMIERGVSPAEVELAIRKPEVTLRQGDATLYQLGELTVVTLASRYQPGAIAVRNVLWRVPFRWTSEQMKRERKRLL